MGLFIFEHDIHDLFTSLSISLPLHSFHLSNLGQYKSAWCHYSFAYSKEFQKIGNVHHISRSMYSHLQSIHIFSTCICHVDKF